MKLQNAVSKRQEKPCKNQWQKTKSKLQEGIVKGRKQNEDKRAKGKLKKVWQKQAKKVTPNIMNQIAKSSYKKIIAKSNTRK